MAAGTAAFMANYFSFTQDVSSRHTGLVVGYLGGLGNLFVAAYQPFAGGLRDWTGSFIGQLRDRGTRPANRNCRVDIGLGHGAAGMTQSLRDLDLE